MNGQTDDESHGDGCGGGGPAMAQDRRLMILYATQTGNAQDLAESLARRAIRQHFTTQCLSMDEYSAVCNLDNQTDGRSISQTNHVSYL